MTKSNPSYAITLAESSRGKYHISEVKYPELNLADEEQTFKPTCGARPTQKAQSHFAQAIQADHEYDFRPALAAPYPAVWEYYTEYLHPDLTCQKCKEAIITHWPRQEGAEDA